jgi:WD40 repeat protein
MWDLAAGGVLLRTLHMKAQAAAAGGSLKWCNVLSFHPDGRHVAGAATGTGMLLQVWDVLAGTLVAGLDHLDDHHHSLDHPSNQPPGRKHGRVGPGAAAAARLSLLNDNPAQAPKRRFTFCEYSPDGTRLAVAANALGTLVWDTHTWALALAPICLRPGLEVGNVRWSRSGMLLAVSCTGDNAVLAWSAPSAETAGCARTWAASPCGRSLRTSV